METLDLLVFYGEGGYAVDDVGEELEVLGVGGADYVAEEHEEGADGIRKNCPVSAVRLLFLYQCGMLMIVDAYQDI